MFLLTYFGLVLVLALGLGLVLGAVGARGELPAILWRSVAFATREIFTWSICSNQFFER